MTDIKALRDGQRKIDVIGTISKIEAPREVSLRTGGKARVANATLADSTGEITLVLWDDQIEQVKEGNVVSISNAYVSAFRSQRQLNIGRYGSMSKMA